MQAYQLSSRRPAAVLLVAGMLALFALSACGGGDEDASAAGAPPTAAPALTATPAPAPPAAALVPATVPEPGSDEELILAVLEKAGTRDQRRRLCAFSGDLLANRGGTSDSSPA